MKKLLIIFYLVSSVALLSNTHLYNQEGVYQLLYKEKIAAFQTAQNNLIKNIQVLKSINADNKESIKKEIAIARIKLKAIDVWLRYLQPIEHKKINGPLLVEWETEVFEKYEKPYKRIGAGLSLAEMYLDENEIKKDSLLFLLNESSNAVQTFLSDSVLNILNKPDHFYFANRLFLLNLSTIYTTGFECPNSENIIPELKKMLNDVEIIYTAFNRTFPDKRFSDDYMQFYKATQKFVEKQDTLNDKFNHFEFLKNYVNPLFGLNQQQIVQHRLVSKNYNDYSLNNSCNTIFSKKLYKAQSPKGIYIAIDDKNILSEIEQVGKLLFYDPILSGNIQRSCASCHKPDVYFNDTSSQNSLAYNGVDVLERNTPSLINAIHQHLIMLDGKHISLQNQASDVITKPNEMNGDEQTILKNILSCDTYNKVFKKLLKQTPEYENITFNHITSALTLYYSKFSFSSSLFDDAMNNQVTVSQDVQDGFNLFMSKAQCGTCHFVPQFNGIKPPFISSEFEVLGVPSKFNIKKISDDLGRYNINSAYETHRAFRTSTIRNSSYTKPYMHNGVFKTIDEVIDFYDSGGGNGSGLNIENQTLSSDSLRLSAYEKKTLKAFISSLDEYFEKDTPPTQLPSSKYKYLNNRKVGGVY